MTWFVIALIALSVLAGAGAKWAVDRIWPPYDVFEAALRIVAAELTKPTPRPRLSDDTMDVLADGFTAGRRSQLGQLMPEHAGRFPAGFAVAESHPRPPGNGYREQGVWTETP